MTARLNLPDYAKSCALTHGFFDDFNHYVTADTWTTVADSGGTVAVGDAVGGRVTITTDGDDNDECYMVSTGEIFLIAAGKSLIMDVRVQYTEANTDDANVYIGLAQEAAANLLVDTGAGPATTLDGVGFFKVDGGTRWQVISSNATTQTKTDTSDTAGGSSFQTLRMEVTPVDATNAEVVFSIDTSGGQDFKQCRENGISPRAPGIKHTVALSGMAEMHAVIGAKAGAANAEAIVVDYLQIWQKR